MMGKKELSKLYTEYRLGKAQEAEGKAKADRAGEQIKAALREMGASDWVPAGQHQAKRTMAAGQTRFDAKRFAVDYPELYQQYMTTGAPTERLYFK